MTTLRCIEIELEDVAKIIAYEANKCHRRLKRPQIHDVQDLIQEGNIVCLRVYKKYNPESNHTFKQFFYRALINRFFDMMDKSYKEINCQAEFMERAVRNCPASLIAAKDCYQELSDAALKYLHLCTNPPEDLQHVLVNSTNQRHGLMRKYLGISLRKERQIRAEITLAVGAGG